MKKTRRQSRKNTSAAVAVFHDGPVVGEVSVTNRGNYSVTVKASFTVLPPGKHGFHIHRAGDLRGEGCKGACSHFHVGPAKNHGGAPGSGERHTGDLGNVELTTNPAEYTYILTGVNVSDFWGRAAIVHADEDDLGLGSAEDSKTTGHSGARIACGIFGRAEGSC